MKRKDLLTMLTSEAEKLARKHNLELFDVEVESKGGSTVLAVKLTSDDQISLDDCHKVHVELSDFLDKEDPIPESYFLEVSSPGLDASLKSDLALSKSIGQEVYVKTYTATDKWPKTLVGILKSYTVKEVEIESEQKIYNISRKMISTIRLHFRF